VNPVSPEKLLIAFFVTGLVMAFAQMLMVPALRLNKNTGALNSCQFISVIMGYAISYYRYGEMINDVEVIGAVLILLGIIGIINCGESAQNLAEKGIEPQMNQNVLKMTN
jgi:drug/metabolite transporter (DMT)-like permease